MPAPRTRTFASYIAAKAGLPMKRMVTVDEVANAVVFLAIPLASGIAGTDLIVDGGTLANLYVQET